MHIPEFDLITFPFQLHKQKFTKVENRYETKLVENKHAKTVFATPTKTSHTFFHITINTNKVKLVGRAAVLFNFVSPVDFLLPIRPEMKEECRKLDDMLIGDSLAAIDEYATEFKNKYYEDKEVFPLYTVPQSLFVGYTATKYLKEGGEENIKRLPQKQTQVVKYKEKVPVKFEGEEECDEEIRNFLENVFQKHAGLRMGFIKNQFKEYNEKNGLSLNLEKLKAELPKFAYFMISGPWGKTWFRYGVDPRTRVDMYLYQTIFGNNRKSPFQIFESADLVEALKKEEDLCFRKSCDSKQGFLTAYGIAKCKHFVKECADRTVENEFEVFD